jgi:hypothetical protein
MMCCEECGDEIEGMLWKTPTGNRCSMCEEAARVYKCIRDFRLECQARRKIEEAILDTEMKLK